MKIFAIPFLFFLSLDSFVVSASQAKRFGLFEASFESHGDYNNPYTDLEAVAEAKRPDGTSASIPLFWDGEKTWKLRISPETIGAWSFGIRSEDEGLNGKQGSFECIDSGLRGGIEIMEGHPHHFQRQDGAPFLFWGDTAWGLYLDKEEENLHRETAFHYIDKRANEGINALHSMLLSEAGWGNNGGAPFEDLQREEINPTYWQEVDLRLRYLNDRGIIGGLVVAWGDKGRGEIYSWRRFPSMDARKRYAQYIAARYSAYDVYFILSGEWHGEAYNWEDITEGEVKANFIEIGEVLAEADIHDRMIGMHPMNKEGSVRDFNEVDWMSFGDYQQNYRDLHQRILESRAMNKPVVNSEYGYYLRDSNFDGKVDKHNSATPEDMRFATWDIIMAGGYPITGYATTYMGGYRDKGPFNPDDPRNLVWTAQYRLAQHFLSSLDWWKLEPHDEWIQASEPRMQDRERRASNGSNGTRTLRRPPLATYWLLADPGRQYVAYGRGLSDAVSIRPEGRGAGPFQATYFNPRTGVVEDLGELTTSEGAIAWTPPDDGDWVLLLNQANR